jgi:hypothetical protein
MVATTRSAPKEFKDEKLHHMFVNVMKYDKEEPAYLALVKSKTQSLPDLMKLNESDLLNLEAPNPDYGNEVLPLAVGETGRLRSLIQYANELVDDSIHPLTTEEWMAVTADNYDNYRMSSKTAIVPGPARYHFPTYTPATDAAAPTESSPERSTETISMPGLLPTAKPDESSPERSTETISMPGWLPPAKPDDSSVSIVSPSQTDDEKQDTLPEIAAYKPSDDELRHEASLEDAHFMYPKIEIECEEDSEEEIVIESVSSVATAALLSAQHGLRPTDLQPPGRPPGLR